MKKNYTKEYTINFLINKYNKLKSNHIQFFLFIAILLLGACTSRKRINECGGANSLTRMRQSINKTPEELGEEFQMHINKICQAIGEGTKNFDKDYPIPALLGSSLFERLPEIQEYYILCSILENYIPISVQGGGNRLLPKLGYYAGYYGKKIFYGSGKERYTDLDNRSNNTLNNNNWLSYVLDISVKSSASYLFGSLGIPLGYVFVSILKHYHFDASANTQPKAQANDNKQE
ncbi:MULTISPECIES: hypothetical protein [Candidatus Cardinium]|uniref:hypothetical protein n=1 Tax=Candidatus Cardinium TaxID=273135 RepID=UPI001FA98091|nr:MULTISPECIES: hypothetical protein [Cardinium]